MSHKKNKAPLLILLVLVITFCVFLFHFNGNKNNWSPTISRWSYSVTVLPAGKRPSSGMSRDEDAYHFIFDEEFILIKDHQLYVNYSQHGTVSTGSVIVVDDGTVSVNGVVHSGIKLAENEALEIALNKRGEGFVGGRKVEFIPSYHGVEIITYTFSKKETLKSGDITISVKGDKYVLNGKEEGVLKPNQGFLVHFGKVSVIDSDNKREKGVSPVI